MDESSGKGSKMQAHITGSGVVMDIAAFKVSHPVGGHPVGVDKDATALQAKKRSPKRSSGAMERYA